MSTEFLLTSLIVILIPGTGVVYTIASAIGGGLRRGVFAAVGCTLGIVPHMAVAMLGLSGVMHAGSAVFEVVRYLGVAYLVFMGVSMVLERGSMRLDDPSAAVGSMRKVVRRGVLANLLNPKLTLFFFAFLPQFLESRSGLIDPALIGLGVVFMLMTFVVFVIYAYLGAVTRERLLGAPPVRRWIERSLGGLLIAFAAKLAVTDR